MPPMPLPTTSPPLPTVALCMPSRGLIHSRTVEATLAALTAARGHADMVGWFMSHDLPIPDCHETLAQRAFAVGADYVWFVEEDMVPSPDALVSLIVTQRRTGAGVVYLDYPVGEHPTQSSVLRQPVTHGGAVLYGGLGCTLITRAVLEILPHPWFTSDHIYLLTRAHDGRYVLTCSPTVGCDYGGHDVAFAQGVRAHGFAVAVVEGVTARHARLRTWGKQRTNHGAHQIDVLTRIEVYHAG